jgi:hypothetical protein
MELVYYQSPERPEERFSFFVIPEDDDGYDNLGELALYHDREGLRWSFGPEDWERFESEGTVWIGSRGVAAEGDGVLPRGQYRAVLVTKGGERTERRFTFDAPEDPRYPFPFISVVAGLYRIDSAYPQNSLICFDGQGNFLKTVRLERLDGMTGELALPSGARGVALWAEDPGYRTSALTDVVPLR